MLGFTGAWWNLTHIIGHWIEDHPKPVVQSVGRKWSKDVSIDRLVADARAKIPGYQPNWFNVPKEDGGDVMMFGAVEGQGVLRSPYGSLVTFKGRTGELTSAMTVKDAGAMAQVLDVFRPLHFGNFGGLPVKILWSIGGLTPAMLAISGSLMWWKRKYPGKRKGAPKKVERSSEKVLTEV